MPSVERYRDQSRQVWRWRGRYIDATGRKRSRTFDTKAAALRWAAEEEAKVARGVRSDPTAARMRWADWAERWITAKGGEPWTRRTDASTLRRHVMPRWGQTPLLAISRLDVQGWVHELAREYSARTTHKAFHLLSGSLRAAVAEGILAANPCAGIALPTVPTGQERFLTDAEAGRILYHLDGRWRVFGELLLGTGLRLAEACGLHAARVDLDALRLEVIEIYDPRESECRGYPKSRHRRVLPLSPELGGLLQEWRDRNPPGASCGRRHRAGRCVGGLLITTPGGAPIDDHNFRARQWRDACERAGFYAEDKTGRRKVTVTPHAFRHTYASRLVQQGVPLQRVQLLLGHESIKTTERYAHLQPADGWDDVRAVLSTSVTAVRAEGDPARRLRAI